MFLLLYVHYIYVLCAISITIPPQIYYLCKINALYIQTPFPEMLGLHCKIN